MVNYCHTYSLALSPILLNAAGHRENFPSCSIFAPLLFPGGGEPVEAGEAEVGRGLADDVHHVHAGAGHARRRHVAERRRTGVDLQEGFTFFKNTIEYIVINSNELAQL